MNKQYAIFGSPVDHSLSPLIHAYFADQHNIEIPYKKILASEDDFKGLLQDFISRGGRGCNITVPLKNLAYELADKQSAAASLACAASCLKISDDGNSIEAENFDGRGFITDLCHNNEVIVKNKDILIIGAGGATQGILLPLIEKQPNSITIANRTLAKAEDLAKQFTRYFQIEVCGLKKLKSHCEERSDEAISSHALTKSFDIIIHTTSMGHTGIAPELPLSIIDENTVCYDLTYGKAAKPFLNWARDNRAAKVIDGLGMLVEHNAALFNWWFGIQPETAELIELLREKIK